MSLGQLQNEADLERWLQDQLSQPGAVPQSAMIGLASRLGKSGTAVATWTGTFSFAGVTIPHGLGNTPTSMSVIPTQTSTAKFVVPNMSTGSPPDATNFTVILATIDSSVPINGTTATVYWAASL